MTLETTEYPATHEPECNDKCDGDSHYLLGDEPEEEDAPLNLLPWDPFFWGVFR